MMDDAVVWYKMADGSYIAATAPMDAVGLVEITEREYMAEMRRRDREAADAEDARTAAAAARVAARAALAARLGLTADELALLG